MRMKTAVVCLLLLVAGAAPAQVTNQRPRPVPRPMLLRPDLVVSEYRFAPTNNKGLRVNVANVGSGNAGACVLRLTVRRINGVAVGRTMEIAVPAIAAGGHDRGAPIARRLPPQGGGI